MYQIMLIDEGTMVWAQQDSDKVVRSRRMTPDSPELSPRHRRHLRAERVEDAVSFQIEACDPRRSLCGADFHHVLTEVSEKVLRVMVEGERAELDSKDRAFIARRVGMMVRPGPGAQEAMTVNDPWEPPPWRQRRDTESAQLETGPRREAADLAFEPHLQRAAKSYYGDFCNGYPCSRESERFHMLLECFVERIFTRRIAVFENDKRLWLGEAVVVFLRHNSCFNYAVVSNQG